MLASLPTEILEPILRACRRQYGYSIELQWKLLALVCRRFRDVLLPIRFEHLGYGDFDNLEDLAWREKGFDTDTKHPFKWEMKNNPWKIQLVKHIDVSHMKAPIKYLTKFPNLVSLDLTHKKQNAALLHLPSHRVLFPHLQIVRLGDLNGLCEDITTEALHRLWTQPKLEEITLLQSKVIHSAVPLVGPELPPLKLLKLWTCDGEDAGLVPLLKIRGVKRLVISEGWGTWTETVRQAVPDLVDFTLITAGGNKDPDTYPLDPNCLKRLSVDVRTFLAWEYGHFLLRLIGRLSGDNRKRQTNQLELLNLEQLTIIIDSLCEDGLDRYPGDEDMIWTPSIFRHLIKSVKHLSPNTRRVVWKFNGGRYNDLMVDFEHQIQCLRTAGTADGMDVRLERFYGVEVPSEASVFDEWQSPDDPEPVYHTPEYLKSLLETYEGNEQKHKKMKHN